MATIYKSLSKRINRVTGMAEVMLVLKHSSSYFLRAKSGIFVTPDNFKDGDIKVNRRKVGNDTEYHQRMKEKMDALCAHIITTATATPIEEITTDWLRLVVDKYMNPAKYAEVPEEEPKKTFYELAEEYITKNDFSESHVRTIKVMIREVVRYEGFRRETENPDYTFDVDTITRDDIEGFIDFYRNEKALSEEYPKVWSRLMKRFPTAIGKGQSVLHERGANTINKTVKRLKALLRWLKENEKTSNNPFEGVKMSSEQYGQPYYISVEERNKIADYDFSDNKALERQRDIFIFHCFVGCRVSDLMRLTADNITDGILVYAPHKTKDEGQQTLQARVPLHPTALALVEKYKGADKAGRLFPFISPQKYNDAIKEIFTVVGITRKVVVRNGTTGENEVRPLNEIASSHLARRTFVGNAYLLVNDPNIIGKMSGHVEGSKAFARYRNIEDSTLAAVINKLG